MAAETPKKRRLKKPETVREKAEKATNATPKPRRLHSAAGKVGTPFRKAAVVGQKEYYLPVPQNRFGKFINKRRHYFPSFFREAWQELRQVTWPSRKETWKLTFAVFLFAITFGVVIALVDFGLDKLFRGLLLK